MTQTTPKLLQLTLVPSAGAKDNAKPAAPALPSTDDTPDSFSWTDSQKLTTQLGQTPYESQSDILALNRNLPRAQGIVGDLPAEWRLKLKPDVSAETSRKTIFTAFKQAMAHLRDECHGEIRPLRGIGVMLRMKQAAPDPEPDISDDTLNRALQETGVIRSNEPVVFKYVDEGNYGTVHQFQVGDKTYALKVFKGGTNPIQNSADFHGSPMEQQRAVFIQRNLPNGPFNRFYFGDINPDGGYMVTDFLKKGSGTGAATELPVVDLSRWGLECGDIVGTKAEDNILQGRIVDYGGICKVEPQKKQASAQIVPDDHPPARMA
jgi:hypothetical protein